jgi:predicted phosphodiesterase
MEFTEECLAHILQLRESKRTSYADLAEQELGNRELSNSLRSALRSYKRKYQTYSILDPIDKLFGDALTLPNEATLVIADTHAPYQNKRLLMHAFRIAKERSVTQFIHAGDLIDGGEYNSQAKNEVLPPIATEIEHARSILYTAQQCFEHPVILPGNHDMYYVKKEKITFTQFIYDVILDGKFADRFTVTDYDYVYYADFATIGHLTNGYDMVAGKIAAQLALKYERHALVGHDHLMGAQQADNGKMGISIGAMFVPGSFAYKARSYNTFPHSQLGFVIIKDNAIHHFDSELNERVYI